MNIYGLGFRTYTRNFIHNVRVFFGVALQARI